MTKKLYDQNPYLHSFTATVVAVVPAGKYYEVYLDQTAFFPESGGQSADKGMLSLHPVVDVKETEQGIAHILALPLTAGETVEGQIDFADRFRKMQVHTAEHIFSGLAHTLFGCENVGFHLGENEVTCDYDICLSDEQIRLLEEKTNQAIWENRTVSWEYPAEDILSTLPYRSKGELDAPVRIVTIDGYDICACCAPHVSKTGEIGGFAVAFHERHRGGTRCYIKAGKDALLYLRMMQDQLAAVSHRLSVPPEKVAEGVARQGEEMAELRQTIYSLRKTVTEMRIASATPKDGFILFFEAQASQEDMRSVLNGCVERCEKACGFFVGNDQDGYRFTLSSRHYSMQQLAETLRNIHSAKCGGTKEMISGTISLTKEDITAFLKVYLR